MADEKKYIWRCRDLKLNLSNRPIIMGILNITPDSFSDGGKYLDVNTALDHALRMQEQGADIIDIGGESSRPGAEPISDQEEIDRVIPIIKRLKSELLVPISIDTYKASVAKEALRVGASIVNDISGLRFDPDMPNVVAEAEAGLVIMHIKGTPVTMQKNPVYEDMFGEINDYFKMSIARAQQAGIQKDQIVLDPGLGFGKKVDDNFALLKNLDKFNELDLPILIGPSRKSFIGLTVDAPVEQRLGGTISAVLCGCFYGAHIVRVHDVLETKQALVIHDKIQKS